MRFLKSRILILLMMAMVACWSGSLLARAAVTDQITGSTILAASGVTNEALVDGDGGVLGKWKPELKSCWYLLKKRTCCLLGTQKTCNPSSCV